MTIYYLIEERKFECHWQNATHMVTGKSFINSTWNFGSVTFSYPTIPDDNGVGHVCYNNEWYNHKFWARYLPEDYQWNDLTWDGLRAVLIRGKAKAPFTQEMVDWATQVSQIYPGNQKDMLGYFAKATREAGYQEAADKIRTKSIQWQALKDSYWENYANYTSDRAWSAYEERCKMLDKMDAIFLDELKRARLLLHIPFVPMAFDDTDHDRYVSVVKAMQDVSDPIKLHTVLRDILGKDA